MDLFAAAGRSSRTSWDRRASLACFPPACRPSAGSRRRPSRRYFVFRDGMTLERMAMVANRADDPGVAFAPSRPVPRGFFPPVRGEPGIKNRPAAGMGDGLGAESRPPLQAARHAATDGKSTVPKLSDAVMRQSTVMRPDFRPRWRRPIRDRPLPAESRRPRSRPRSEPRPASKRRTPASSRRTACWPRSSSFWNG